MEQLEFDFRRIEEWFHSDIAVRFRDEVYLAVAGQIEQGRHPIYAVHNVPGLPNEFTLNVFGYALSFTKDNPGVSLGNTVITYDGGIIGPQVQMVSIVVNPSDGNGMWWKSNLES